MMPGWDWVTVALIWLRVPAQANGPNAASASLPDPRMLNATFPKPVPLPAMAKLSVPPTPAAVLTKPVAETPWVLDPVAVGTAPKTSKTAKGKKSKRAEAAEAPAAVGSGVWKDWIFSATYACPQHPQANLEEPRVKICRKPTALQF